VNSESPSVSRDVAGCTPSTLTHLQRLEAESIHIMREVAAEARKRVTQRLPHFP
jgi:sulfate adenylyltransferase subunit 2